MFRLSIALLSLWLSGLAAPALALDIGRIEVLWLTDRADGSLLTNPYGFEIDVDFNDATGVGAVEMVTPAGGVGTVALHEHGSAASWHINTAVFGSATNLFLDFPNGNYTVNVFDSPGTTVIDFVTITINAVEVMDFLDVTDPADMSTIPTTQSVTWTDCSTCDGRRIVGFLDVAGTDTEVDEFDTTNKATTSWSPAGMVPSMNYEIEMILANYTHFKTTEFTNDSDAFSFLAGYESVNSINVTTVPEPGTALLLGFGLTAGLAAARRLGPVGTQGGARP